LKLERENLIQEFAKRLEHISTGLQVRTPSASKGENVSPTKILTETPEQLDAMRFGSAVHKGLELLIAKGPGDLRSVALEVARDFSMPQQEHEIFSCLMAVNECPLMERIQNAKNTYPELAFSILESDGSLVEGAIDLVIEEDDGFVVVDYKTDRIQPENSKKHSLLYVSQIQDYVSAVETLTGKVVKEGLILYVRLGHVEKIERRSIKNESDPKSALNQPTA
jgi:ATP-dependent helicase/nuclease subunit A